jgi:hypothetical protein
MRKEEKDILYVYATPENKEFIDALCEKHNEKISSIVNLIIEGFRTNKKVVFETIIPKFVKQAEEWKKKHVT